MKFLTYGALRIGTFIVAFVLTYFLFPNIWFAAIVGLIISFGVGYLFAPNLRESASQQMSRAFTKKPKQKRVGRGQADADAEDAMTAGQFLEGDVAEGQAEAAREAQAVREAFEAEQDSADNDRPETQD